jgi:hypothetical protein
MVGSTPVTPLLATAPAGTLPGTPSPERPLESAETGSRPTSPWIYATGAVGLAGLAVGTVTGILTLTAKSTVDADCGIGGVRTACTSTGQSAADRAETTGLASTIGFSVGTAGVVMATVLWVVRPKAPASSSAHVSPLVTASERGAMVGAGGSFQ